jgi:hypothetical protein
MHPDQPILVYNAIPRLVILLVGRYSHTLQCRMAITFVECAQLQYIDIHLRVLHTAGYIGFYEF